MLRRKVQLPVRIDPVYLGTVQNARIPSRKLEGSRISLTRIVRFLSYFFREILFSLTLLFPNELTRNPPDYLPRIAEPFLASTPQTAPRMLTTAYRTRQQRKNVHSPERQAHREPEYQSRFASGLRVLPKRFEAIGSYARRDRAPATSITIRGPVQTDVD